MSEVQPAAPEPQGNVAAPAAPSTPEVTPQTTPSMEDTMAAAFDKMNPQERVDRAPDGKFASTAAPEAAAPDEQPSEGQTQTAAPSEPAQPAIAPPQSLPAELRDEWTKAPPKLAEWASKREAESHKRITELGETAKAHAPFRQVIERFAPTLQKQGLPPADAFARMLAVNDLLEQDAPGAIAQIAEAYGVDLSAVAGKPQGEAAENAEVRSLKAELNALKRQIADTANRVTSREQQEAEAQRGNLAKLVEDFSADKSDHWADIEADVLEQIAAIRHLEKMNGMPEAPAEQVLKKAYDRAVKINEQVANKLSEATRKAEAEKAEAEKKRKADEAKRLASLNVRSKDGASPKPSGSWEDTMREVGNRLLG